VSAFVESEDNKLLIKDLSIKMVNIGNCVENNTLIIMFEDTSKIFLTSWNKFNCEGNAWFKLEESDIKMLSTKKLLKIKITNGRSFESMTMTVPDIKKDFFIQLFYAVEKRKLKELKTKE
jgi:hypothetical protein